MKNLCVLLVCCLLNADADRGCDTNTCTTCEGDECVTCTTGYYKINGTCYPCSTYCYSCSSRETCDHCNEGYYKRTLLSGSDCGQCSPRCISCSSDTECTKCETGFYTYTQYFGKTYCSPCSEHCTSCSSDTQCTACDTGYYTQSTFWGYTYCSPCPKHCTSCASATQCTACDTGYYTAYDVSASTAYCYQCPSCTACPTGHYREINDLQSKTVDCVWCSFHCNSCISNTQCTECVTGYYTATHSSGNTYCSMCPINCIRCDSNTQCTACKTDYYGATCTYSCQDHCVDGECTIDGCVRGCRDGYYKDSDNVCNMCLRYKCKLCSSNDNCNQCEAGFYKDQDQYCTSCSSATQCTACEPGFYTHMSTSGQTCESCPLGCAICSSNTQCTACKTGHYGVTCDYSCQDHCVDGACTINGCTRGCRNGYYKDSDNVCKTCSTNCNGVAKCNPDNGACSDGCKPGWTGGKCLEPCPENCANCNQFESDKCETCERGYYGTSCEIGCSQHCNIGNAEIQICFKDNGTCSLGCMQGFWGPRCNDACSDSCADTRACSPTDGRCDTCIADRYGDQCEVECNSNCMNTNNGSNVCDRRTGACLHGCTSGIGGATCEEDGSAAKGNVDEGDASVNIAMVACIGGSVMVLAVGVVVVVCIVRRRRRNRKSLNTEEAPVPMTENDEVIDPASMNLNPVPAKREESVLMEASGPSTSRISTAVRMSELPSHGLAADTDEIDIEIEEDEHGVIPAPVLEQTPDTYYNIAGLVRSRIDVDKLQEYVHKKTNKDFMKEFMKFPTGLIRPYNAAMQNIANNRYQNIYPYDASRVVLKNGPSDYINATYIDSYSQYNTYIASLGPTNKTMPDYMSFWTMVWQEKVEVIVMVTNLMEGTTMKCEQYWPGPGTSMTYGDVTVTCHSEDVYAEYTVRSFTVQFQTTETRTLHHIHFTAWPDKGVPDDVTSLIEFRQKVITCPTKLDGPTLVHCSAGIGRTGTYIALDILTREGRAEKSVDVFGCVIALRGLRVNMVQTAEQYEYLHNALVHTLTFDCGPIQADKVRQLLTPSQTSTMYAQFEHLQLTTDDISADEKKVIATNKALPKKNRPDAEIPGRRHRPWLHLLRKSGSSNYINAVFVNSFKQKDRYVVAQTPLPTTVVDFLTLVMQTDCPCIVSLDDDTQRDKTVGVYIPAVNEVSKHGIFQVKCISSETTPQYTLRQLEFSTHGKSSLEPRSVYHFQCTMWGTGDKVPNDSTAFLQLTRDVDRMSLKALDTESIVVHCLTGAERSGLFCVVSVLIQKMEIEHQVSVVNTVRQVKARRRRAIPNKEQYKFCHECLSAFIKSFNTYSNFTQ